MFVNSLNVTSSVGELSTLFKFKPVTPNTINAYSAQIRKLGDFLACQILYRYGVGNSDEMPLRNDLLAYFTNPSVYYMMFRYFTLEMKHSLTSSINFLNACQRFLCWMHDNLRELNNKKLTLLAPCKEVTKTCKHTVACIRRIISQYSKDSRHQILNNNSLQSLIKRNRWTTIGNVVVGRNKALKEFHDGLVQLKKRKNLRPKTIKPSHGKTYNINVHHARSMQKTLIFLLETGMNPLRPQNWFLQTQSRKMNVEMLPSDKLNYLCWPFDSKKKDETERVYLVFNTFKTQSSGNSLQWCLSEDLSNLIIEFIKFVRPWLISNEDWKKSSDPNVGRNPYHFLKTGTLFKNTNGTDVRIQTISGSIHCSFYKFVGVNIGCSIWRKMIATYKRLSVTIEKDVQVLMSEAQLHSDAIDGSYYNLQNFQKNNQRAHKGFRKLMSEFGPNGTHIDNNILIASNEEEEEEENYEDNEVSEEEEEEEENIEEYEEEDSEDNSEDEQAEGWSSVEEDEFQEEKDVKASSSSSSSSLTSLKRSPSSSSSSMRKRIKSALPNEPVSTVDDPIIILSSDEE
ncbi:hypothetical protein CYY_010554 [Polysphondylium violaceum]|uniref:Uncharacterized protein n=1 Tax=Polysphondylium violaceum TaxID=133409 RepID=A0A8J4PK29_9MYCE|nr:hypothetical protein CYY_010554 [Polysphondylium violaceum]